MHRISRTISRVSYALAALTLVSPALADTIYVNGTDGNDSWTGRCAVWDGASCGPKQTIAAAVATAIAGDEIVLADGTYTGAGNRNVTVAVRLIVRSAGGCAETCVIDCDGQSRAFSIAATAAHSEVRDLTIRNGRTDDGGGGIRSTATDATVSGCVFEGCRADGQNAEGGGLYLQSGTIADSAFLQNSSGWAGGGAYLRDAGSVLSCTFAGNLAGYEGGGLANGYPPVHAVSDCFFEGNRSGMGGGFSGGNCFVNRCHFVGNYAYGHGGGGVAIANDSTIVNCVLTRNWGVISGAGLADSDRCVFVNCTMVDNVSDYSAAMDYWYGVICNCVVRGNVPANVSSRIRATYCNIEGGHTGVGNFDVEPGFAFGDDFHLVAGSSCISAGTNSPPAPLPDTDYDGNPRVLPAGGQVDVGAYEFNDQQPTLAVSPDGIEIQVPAGSTQAGAALQIRNAGGGVLSWTASSDCNWVSMSPSSGSSSGEVDPVQLSLDLSAFPHGQYSCLLTVSDDNATSSPHPITLTVRLTATLHVPAEYATIQAAVDAAVSGDTVEIAPGSYTGPGNRGVEFRGKAITVRGAGLTRDSVVIDPENQDEAFVFQAEEKRESILEHLTIRHGAGGVWMGGAAPTIRDCVIEDCSSSGIVIGSNSKPVIEDCLIRRNTSENGGGVNGQGSSEFTLRRCQILNNTATWTGEHEGGGGVWWYADNFPFRRPIRLENCLIAGNATPGRGGGVFASGDTYDDTFLVNCTIVGNTAGAGGGYAMVEGHFTDVDNCIIWGNEASLGPQVAMFSDRGRYGDLDLNHSDLQGGVAGIYNEQGPIYWEGSIDADPLFENGVGGDFHLTAGSPCVDTGDPGFMPPPSEDLDGHVRVWNGRIDMGAYEFASAPFGDMNCDGVVDNSDIDGFVLALVDPAGYAATYPACSVEAADTNHDGVVDNSDIDGFVALLLGN